MGGRERGGMKSGRKGEGRDEEWEGGRGEG